MDYRGALHRDGSVLMSVSLDQLRVKYAIRFPHLVCLFYFLVYHMVLVLYLNTIESIHDRYVI